MNEHIKPTIRKENPNCIIIHAETNDILIKHLYRYEMKLLTWHINVSISAIVPHNDNLEYHDKVEGINSYLANICKNIDFHFIKHDNIKPESQLDSSKLHLIFL